MWHLGIVRSFFMRRALHAPSATIANDHDGLESRTRPPRSENDYLTVKGEKLLNEEKSARQERLSLPKTASTRLAVGSESEHDRRMIAIAFLFVCVLCDCFKSRRRQEAEILLLRHQLNFLQQCAPRRLHLLHSPPPGSLLPFMRVGPLSLG